jgi:hypothetical protein
VRDGREVDRRKAAEMDDVIDLRTRLIYASLQDDDLVRQLEEARTAADRQPARRLVPAPVQRPAGTRPWVTRPTTPAGDVVTADVPSSASDAYVVDLRDQRARAVRVDASGPPVGAVVSQHRSSEWSTDDPSDYLG